MKINHVLKGLLLIVTITMLASCDDDSPSGCPQISQASAGDDQNIADGNSIVLAANEPASSETGAWTVVTGDGGEFDDATKHNATFTGALGVEYVLRWTLSSTCSETTSVDEVTVIIACPGHGIENAAGEDQEIVSVETNLNAQLPENHTGYWTIVSGEGGNIDDEENPTSLFAGVLGEEYTLKWTLTSACGTVTEDEVVIKLVDLNAIPFTEIAQELLENAEELMSTNNFILANNEGLVLPEGSRILFKTGEGRYGKMTVSYFLNPTIVKMILNGVIYNADGSIFSQSNNTEVRSTWHCDLDQLIETTNTEVADFYILNGNPILFSTRNGAKFYVVN